MAIPGPGGLFGVTGPSSIAEDAICATIIVGNTAQGDVPGITCHVVDDIAAGLVLLPAVGGTLHIKRGTYNPAAAIVINQPNVTIQGEDATVINKPAGLNLFEIPVGMNFITIRNLRNLNGQGDITGGNLIDIDRAQDILIENCCINNNPGNPPGVDAHGIEITGTQPSQSLRIRIVGCRIDGCGRGIYAESTDAAVITVADVNIHECQIFDSQKEGIYLLFTDRSTITDTLVSNSGTSGSYDGVLIAGKAAGNRTQRHLINALRIDNATDDGLEMEFCDETIIVKVISVDNTRDGINFNDADRNVINGVVCTGNGDDGIDIDAQCDRNIVDDAQLTGNAGTNLVNNGTNTNLGHNITV